jgi:hypothetical protein
MQSTIYKQALHILSSEIDKKKKYSNITIHTITTENMTDILNMLVHNFQIDISNVKLNFSKKKTDYTELFYYNTLAYETADTTTYPFLKVCFDDAIVKEKILEFCNNPKVTNRSFWYPERPDNLSSFTNKYFHSSLTTESMPKYPIYIISKGRADIIGTAKFLDECRVDYKLVVEPKEFDEYAKYNAIDKLLVCPENFSERGHGGIPVRNFVWQHSKDAGAEKHWILDDNIHNYKRIHQGQKVIIKSPWIFRIVENFVDRFTNVKMAGHNYSFFSAGNANPIIKNTRVFSSILLTNDIYPEFAWRGRYNEDVDLSIRILKAGFPTVLFNSITANKATTMTCKGGNTDTIYSVENAHLKKATELQVAHPDVVKVVEKFGRIHHNANLNSFKDNNFDWKLTNGKKIIIKRKNTEYDLVLKNK